MKKLIVDAGHGGRDPGTAHFGYEEKDLNLVIAKRVHYLLNKEYKGEVDLTRATDITIESDDRTDIVKNKYEYCISVHLNSFNETSSGIETIHSIHGEKGKKLAEYIAASLNEEMGLGIKKVFTRTYESNKNIDYYYMHRETGKTTTIIVEGLYLSNPSDLPYLNVEKIAQGIAKGFIKFIDESEELKEDKEMLVFDRVLKKGCTGEDVKVLQMALINYGFYDGKIDGSFGPATDRAVRNYQMETELVVDGLVGPATTAALNNIKKK